MALHVLFSQQVTQTAAGRAAWVAWGEEALVGGESMLLPPQERDANETRILAAPRRPIYGRP